MKYFCLLLGLFLLLLNSVYADTPAASNGRFQVVYEQSNSLTNIIIIKDTQTNVQYLYCKYGFGAAMTKLEEQPHNDDTNK